MDAIQNRYELLWLSQAKDCNPNGDPDMDNMPRQDPDTKQGLITGISVKRHIRDYISMVHGNEPGMGIFVEDSTNKNRKIAEIKEAAEVELSDKSKPAIEKSRAKACKVHADTRFFGGVMGIGPNAGQVRGPVCVNMARSYDPINPQDMAITCVSKAIEVKDAKTAKDYKDDEDKRPADQLQGMGRFHYVPFGLYLHTATISANLAQQTGFSEKDLTYLLEAIANMYDALPSASKGGMSLVSPVIVFKHVGDGNSSPEAQANQALIGRAPAHKLFELVSCTRKDPSKVASDYRDYDCTINLSGRPDGIEVGFLPSYGTEISWNKLPDNETWIKAI